jgi:hypothetical protein
MKKSMLMVGLFTMVSCKEKEVKHQNENEYCCSYSILEIPGRKPKLLCVEQENGLISFLLEKNGKVIRYEEMYNFHPLDSNECKLLIKWVKEDTIHPVISNFKNALMERLERDRTEYEMTMNDIKN